MLSKNKIWVLFHYASKDRKQWRNRSCPRLYSHTQMLVWVCGVWGVCGAECTLFSSCMYITHVSLQWINFEQQLILIFRSTPLFGNFPFLWLSIFIWPTFWCIFINQIINNWIIFKLISFPVYYIENVNFFFALLLTLPCS